MTAKASLQDITNANSFGDWRVRTNELISVAKKSVTFGVGESTANVGDVTIDGDLSLGSGHTATFDKIDTTGGYNQTPLLIKKHIDLQGILYVNQDTGGGSTESIIQMTQGNVSKTNTWQVGTTNSHANFNISHASNGVSLNIATDGTFNSVGSTDVTIPSSMIDGGAINGVSIGATTPGTGAFTSLIVNGSGATGSIDDTTIGGTTPQSGSFTELIASGGSNSAIDDVPIGASQANSGAFTTLSTSGNATIGGDLTVTGTANVAASSAESLTNDAITQVLNVIYPVGAIYITAQQDSTVPNFLPGTWERYAQGCALVGFDGGATITQLSQTTLLEAIPDLSVAEGDSATIITVQQPDSHGHHDGLGIGPGFYTEGHGFAQGDRVRLSGFNGGNGVFVVVDVPESNDTNVFAVHRSISSNNDNVITGQNKASLYEASYHTYPGGVAYAGNRYGKNVHNMIESELPEHNHIHRIKVSRSYSKSNAGSAANGVVAASDGSAFGGADPKGGFNAATSSVGRNRPFSTVSRSQVVWVWKRVAD